MTLPFAPGVLAPDHALFDLQTLGALLSARAVVVADLPDADAVAHLARSLRDLRPEAEPELWTDGLDHPRGLWWEAVGLDLAAALAIGAELADHTPRWWILPAEPPGRRRAWAQGRVVADLLTARGVSAVRAAVPDRDLDLTDDLRRIVPRDPEVLALIAEMQASLDHAVGPHTLPPGAARVTVRRRDGRIGLHLPLTARAPLSPEALRAHRAAAWGAVVDVIAARAGHRALRVVPAGVWWDRSPLHLPGSQQLHLHVPLLVAPAPGLPTGHPGPRDAWLDPGPRCVRLGIELRATEAADPEVARAEVEATLVDGEAEEPVTLPDGAVAWAWSARGLVRRPAAEGWRVLPRVAAGLLDRELDLTAHAHLGTGMPGIAGMAGARWFVRWRDDLADADLAEVVTERPADARDREVVTRIVDVLEAARVEPDPTLDDRWLRTVADSAGAPGLALNLDPDQHLDEGRWRAALDALGFDLRTAAGRPGLGPLATVALPRGSVLVHLWYDEPTREDPRWAPAPAQAP